VIFFSRALTRVICIFVLPLVIIYIEWNFTDLAAEKNVNTKTTPTHYFYTYSKSIYDSKSNLRRNTSI